MKIETYKDGKLVKTETVPDPAPDAEDEARQTLAAAIAGASSLAALKAALLGTETGVSVAPETTDTP